MKKLLSAYHLLHVLLMLLGVVALPAVAHILSNDWQRYQQAQLQYDLANRIQQGRASYSKDVKNFNQYSQDAAAFLESSRQYRIGESYWEPYEVRVKDQLLGYAELDSLLANAKHGGNFYFAPQKIDILTDLTTASLPKGMAERLKKEKIEAGSKALVTLEGAFYVFRR